MLLVTIKVRCDSKYYLGSNVKLLSSIFFLTIVRNFKRSKNLKEISLSRESTIQRERNPQMLFCVQRTQSHKCCSVKERNPPNVVLCYICLKLVNQRKFCWVYLDNVIDIISCLMICMFLCIKETKISCSH